jgi:hypothetical protein
MTLIVIFKRAFRAPSHNNGDGPLPKKRLHIPDLDEIHASTDVVVFLHVQQTSVLTVTLKEAYLTFNSKPTVKDEVETAEKFCSILIILESLRWSLFRLVMSCHLLIKLHKPFPTLRIGTRRRF